MSTTPSPSGKRKKTILLLAGLFALAGIGYGIWWAIEASHYESTDDAYVAGNVVQITPQVSGTVVAIRADDTDFVKAGQDLIQIDQADARVTLDQAEAQLAQTVREVRTLYANNATLTANIATRQADVVKAQTELAKAQDDYKRRQSLIASGAVSKEELQHVEVQIANARSAMAAAEAAVNAAREQLTSNRTLTDGTTVEKHPNVQRAAGRVREAWLALSRTTLPAPVSGYVAKRSVQVGQRVAPGLPLMAIVPLEQVWVDANFKEVQLRKMRIGQPVTLVADVYGAKIEYSGKVLGMAAGTGGAFALLPAQNATGNWIKVVQRVPVRIGLDAQQLAAHPLRVGLSMEAKVDVANDSGDQLASAQRTEPAWQTAVFTTQADDAGVIVRKIIAANLGGGAPAATTAAPAAAQH